MDLVSIKKSEAIEKRSESAKQDEESRQQNQSQSLNQSRDQNQDQNPIQKKRIPIFPEAGKEASVRLSRNEIAENAIGGFEEKVKLESWESPLSGIDVENFSELLRRMQNDTNKKSPEFLRMEEAVENLVKLKENNTAARSEKDGRVTDYRDALSLAEGIVRGYKVGHARLFFVRKYPSERYQISCRLLDLITRLRGDIQNAIIKDIEGAEEEKEKKESAEKSIDEIIDTGAFSAEEAGKQIKDWLAGDKQYKSVLKRIVSNKEALAGDKEVLLKFLEDKNRQLVANKVALSLLCDEHPELTFHISAMKKRLKTFVEKKLAEGEDLQEKIYSDGKEFRSFLNDCVREYKTENKDFLQNVSEKRERFLSVLKVDPNDEGLWSRGELAALLMNETISEKDFSDRLSEYADQKKDNEQIVNQMVDAEKYSILLSAPLKLKIKEKLGALLLFGGEIEIADQTRKYLDVKNYLCPREAAMEDSAKDLMISWRIPKIQKDAFVTHLTEAANAKRIDRLSYKDANLKAKEFSANLIRSFSVIEKSGIKNKKLTKSQWESFNSIRRFSGNYSGALLKKALKNIAKPTADGEKTMSLREFDKLQTTTKRRGIGLSERLLGDQFLGHEDVKGILKKNERIYLRETLISELFTDDEALAFLEYSSASEIRRMGKIMRDNITANAQKIAALRDNGDYHEQVKLKVLLKLACAGNNLDEESFEKILKQENEEFQTKTALKQEMKDVRECLGGKPKSEAIEQKTKAFRVRLRLLSTYERGRYKALAQSLVRNEDFYLEMMNRSEDDFCDYIAAEVDKKYCALGEALKADGSGYLIQRRFISENAGEIFSGRLSGNAMEWKRRLNAFAAGEHAKKGEDGRSIDENIETAVKEARKKLLKRYGKGSFSEAEVLHGANHFIEQMFADKTKYKTLLSAEKLRERIVEGMELYRKNLESASVIFGERLGSALSPFSTESKAKKQARRAQFGKYVREHLYEETDFEENVWKYIEAFEKDQLVLKGYEKAPENIEEICEEIKVRQDIKKAAELKNQYLGLKDERIASVLGDIYSQKSLVNIGTEHNVNLSHASQQFVRENLTAKLSVLIGEDLTPMIVNCIVERNLASWSDELLGRTPGLGWLLKKLDAEGSASVKENAIWLSRVKNVLAQPDEGEDPVEEDELNLMLVNVYRHEADFARKGGKALLHSMDRERIKGKWYHAFRKNYKELQKLERMKVNHPSLEQERASLSRNLRGLLATGLGIKDQDAKASLHFAELAERSTKYIGFVSGFYSLIGERMEKSKDFSGLNEYTKNVYIERIRAYYNSEFMYEISNDSEGAVSLNVEKWTEFVDRLLADPYRMARVKSAEQTISGEREAAKNTNFAEVHGRETIDAVIEKYAWRGQRNKYKALSEEQKQLFALGLMLMDKSAIGLSGGSNDVLANPAVRKQEIMPRLAELAKFIQGKPYDFRIDYGQAYYKLTNFGYDSLNSLETKLSDSAFNKAMEFAEGIQKRMNAATDKDLERIEDSASNLNEAALLGKTDNLREVERLREVSFDYKRVKKQLLLYAQADQETLETKIGIASFVPFKNRQMKKEQALIEKVAERLKNLSGEDARRLVVILQNRTALDHSAVDGSKFVNEKKREECKLLLSDESAMKNMAPYLTSDACYQAIISALSYQVKDDERLGDKMLSKSNFEQKSFERASRVDWELLNNAISLMDELDREYLARYAVRNAKDFIESAGNEKAATEYEKYREEKNMTGERLEMILSDQAKNDAKTGANKDAILAVAGYQRLSDPQKRLFFKALLRRDLLDISKKNLYRNIWSAKAERGFVNEADRFRLIDEYIDQSFSKNAGVTLADGAYYEAFKSLLSTQVDDTVDFKSKEQVKDVLAGEEYYLFKRDTAVDWKLFMRALQFVHRADYELRIREGNAELYRSAGELSRYGHMSMDYGILRRNIHHTGNQFLRFGTQRTKETLRKDFIPNIKIAKNVAASLSFTAGFLPKSIGDVENEIVGELLNPKAKDEVSKSKNPYFFQPEAANKKVKKDRAQAEKEHITEIDYVQDRINNILSNKDIMEKSAVEVGKAISLLLPDPYKGGEFKEKKRVDVLGREIKGFEQPFRYGDVRDDIAKVKGKYEKISGTFDKYANSAKAVAKGFGYDFDKMYGGYVNHLKSALIEKIASGISGGEKSGSGMWPAILAGYEREKQRKLEGLKEKALAKLIKSGKLKKGDALDPKGIAEHKYWKAKDEELTDSEKLKATQDVAKDYFAGVLKGMFGEERAKHFEEDLKAVEDFSDTLREKLTWISAITTTARTYADSFMDVADRVKKRQELADSKKRAESGEVAARDQRKLELAADFQNEDQKEMVRDVVGEHQKLQEMAGSIAGTIQAVEISRDLIGAAVQTGVLIASASGGAAKTINMVGSAVRLGVDCALYFIRIMKDRKMLRDYYTNTAGGADILNGIKANAKGMFKETAEENEHIKNDHVLRILCAGMGYEKEEELLEDTGLKLAASVAYSASNYNPILQNKIVATTVMTVLGLKDKVGKTDGATIQKIFESMRAA